MTTPSSTERLHEQADSTAAGQERPAPSKRSRATGDPAPRPWLKRAGYYVTQAACQVGAVPVFHLRCFGRQQIPSDGPVLVCANHQSVIDPVILGTCIPRPMSYLARKTLFRVPLLGSLIRFYDGIPIDRDGMGVEGIKETLRRLRRQEMVLIFPEGTRTLTGDVAPLKRGFCSIARRGKAALLPVALDGAFEAWPRGVPVPRPTTIEVHIGRPIMPEEAAAFDDATLVNELEQRIRACHAAARARRRRPASG